MDHSVYRLMRFSEKLDKLIDLRHTNQSELSRKTGIAQSAISDMTRGERRPYMDQSLLLARALDVPLDYLADDSLDEPPPASISEWEKKVWEVVKEIGAELAWKKLVRPERAPAVPELIGPADPPEVPKPKIRRKTSS